MPHDNIMIDLETMSICNDAAIISIGAVRIDLEARTLGDKFYRVVNLKSSQRAGGIIDAETVMWWMQQSEEARKAITGDDSLLIDTVLKEFSEWVRGSPTQGIWGHGAGFDNVILESAYRRSAKTPPWSFGMNRCYRTMAALRPDITRAQFRTGTRHNALDDAITQGYHLCAILEKK